MNLTLRLFVKILFCCVVTAQAQDHEFGKVSKEELSEKEYGISPDADAAVLYRHQNTYYIISGSAAQLITEVHERIKIYNKDGFEKATESVVLFKGQSSSEKFKDLKAFTYNLENNEIVITELDSDHVFENEFSYNYDLVKFTMPNVKEGSVIEFKYEIASPFIWNIDEFRFQSNILLKKLMPKLELQKDLFLNKIKKDMCHSL